MNVKEANQIIYDYMQDTCCMCLVTNLCPSPSSHHDFCINEDCKKRITDLSYNPYARSLDSLATVWQKLVETKITESEGLMINAIISPRSVGVDIASNIDTNYGGFELEQENGKSIQETYCIATAKAIQHLANE